LLLNTGKSPLKAVPASLRVKFVLVSFKKAAMKWIVFLLLMGSCHPTARQNGGDTLTVKKGDSFDIPLAVNLGSGYSWVLRDSAFENLLRADTQFIRTNVRDVDNGPEEQVFRFVALKKGETRLRFLLQRPWKKEEAPREEKEYRIIIQ
jgi:predicted secreted protein